MNLPQSVDINLTSALPIILGCVCLCGLGFVLISGLHVIGGFLHIFTSIFGVVFDVLSGGPVSWCGCLVLLVVCIGVAGFAVLVAQGLSTCGTPQAINICTLLGR